MIGWRRRRLLSGWRGWALESVLARYGIGEPILRHLTTFQRLGATLDAAPPRAALPLGARRVLGALRTRAAADVSPGWVWPLWLERQLDPRDEAFTARGHLPVLQNVTHRNWTLVGNVGSCREAIVDPSGLVTLSVDGWSLDWWVHDGRRWRFPSRERVAQRLVGTAPVVETSLALDGGPAVQRVYAVEGPPEGVVVELRNGATASRSMAVAVRPVNPEGLAVIERLAVHGRELRIDGRVAVVLPLDPERTVLSSFAGGDSAGLLEADGEAQIREVRDPAGLAQGACVLTVAAGACLKVWLPFDPPARTRPRSRRQRRRPASLPDGAEVADVLRTYPSRQRPDGYFHSQWREWDANGAAL